MIWTLFWKKEPQPNIVEECYPEFIKQNQDLQLGWINSTDWKGAITMYRDIWMQRIDEHGYGASTEDLKIIGNAEDFWSNSPRTKTIPQGE